MLGTWQRSDNNSVKSHRKLVDAINALSDLSSTGDLFTETSQQGSGVLDKRRPWDDEYKNGVIVSTGPNGEADFGNNQYWVKVADIDPIVADETDTLTATAATIGVASPDGTTYQPTILCVTNRFEALPSGDGTHALWPGKWVRYRSVFEGDDQVRFAMEEPPPAILGTIVCAGPCGEPDFPDWRYWVAFIDATNTTHDKREAPILEAAYRYPPPVCPPVESSSSSSAPRTRPAVFAKIIQAANFNEYDCDTHLVRPGTPVRLEWVPDHESNPSGEKWFFQVADLTTCFPECKEGHCCRCYQVKYSLEPGIQPIRMYQMGSSKNWVSSDGASSLMLYGGKWNLTLFDGTIYTALASSPCPPLDPESWVLESGSTTLLSFDCCEPSSSSSSSSSGACCTCYQVDFQGNSYQLNQASDDKWTSDDDTVSIEGDGSGNWTLTITVEGGRGVWYATGPCPPEGMEAWGGTTGHDFPTVSCCPSSSSSSSSSSSGSSSSGSSGSSSSGPCTPICGIRYNTSSRCFEYTTDGSSWHQIENACAGPCGTTGGG